MCYLLTAGSEYSVLTVNYDSGNKMWQVQYHDLRARADPRFPTKLNKLEGASKKKKNTTILQPPQKKPTNFQWHYIQVRFPRSILSFLYLMTNNRKTIFSSSLQEIQTKSQRQCILEEILHFQNVQDIKEQMPVQFCYWLHSSNCRCTFWTFVNLVNSGTKKTTRKKIITLTINGKILIQTRRFIFKTTKLIQWLVCSVRFGWK